jgi:hypothetical protein
MFLQGSLKLYVKTKTIICTMIISCIHTIVIFVLLTNSEGNLCRKLVHVAEPVIPAPGSGV